MKVSPGDCKIDCEPICTRIRNEFGQENDDGADGWQTVAEEKVAEIEILGDDDPRFRVRHGEQVGVEGLRIGLGCIVDVQANTPHRLDDHARATFVGKDLHLFGSDRDVIGEIIGSVSERCEDIRLGEARILVNDFGDRQPAQLSFVRR